MCVKTIQQKKEECILHACRFTRNCDKVVLTIVMYNRLLLIAIKQTLCNIMNYLTRTVVFQIGCVGLNYEIINYIHNQVK